VTTTGAGGGGTATGLGCAGTGTATATGAGAATGSARATGAAPKDMVAALISIGDPLDSGGAGLQPGSSGEGAGG